jgi:hypothetical protein
MRGSRSTDERCTSHARCASCTERRTARQIFASGRARVAISRSLTERALNRARVFAQVVICARPANAVRRRWLSQRSPSPQSRASDAASGVFLFGILIYSVLASSALSAREIFSQTLDSKRTRELQHRCVCRTTGAELSRAADAQRHVLVRRIRRAAGRALPQSTWRP